MAITDKEQGVWELEQVYNKINQGDIWEYTAPKELWMWGRNDFGQIGQNTQAPINSGRSSPLQISGTTWSNLGTVHYGYSRTATKSDGTLWGWGRNNYGQIGNNSIVPGPSDNGVSSPVQCGSDTTWSTDIGKLSSGNYGQCKLAVKTDGSLWALGNDTQGRLAQNTEGVAKSSPVQIPGTWGSCAAGMVANYAISTGGALYGWGQNNLGQIGNEGTDNRSSPIQLGTGWALVSGGRETAMAVKTDGTLWSWGGNENGCLGQNNDPPADRSSPTQVGTDTTWSTRYGTFGHTQFSVTAIKTDGTLWAWGQNPSGQLGIPTIPAGTRISSPTQVGTDTTWNVISGQDTSYIATKTDGSLWAWGANTRGALGQGDVTAYSSPKQIGTGTGWTQVVGGNQGGGSIKQL